MTVSTRDLLAMVGKPAMATVGTQRRRALHVPVVVMQARERWGRIDVLVTPVGGSGKQWLELGTIVQLTESEESK